MVAGHDARRWQVPLELEAIAAIEPQVADFLEGAAVDDRATFVSRLVIEEIARNLIEHAASAMEDAPMLIEIRVRPDAVIVVVEDSCRPFDPADAPGIDATAPLEDRRPGGMGLHLVRTMTDRLTYEPRENRNRLTATVLRS